MEQRLKARAVFVLSRFHHIGIFLDDEEVAVSRQSLEFSPLGVDGDVAAVLAGAKIESCAMVGNFHRSILCR
jgi:hypothetical protein